MPYVCGRTIGALWAINEPNNVWVRVNELGWRKLDTENTVNLLLVAARAKIDQTVVDLAEEIRVTAPISPRLSLFRSRRPHLRSVGAFPSASMRGPGI